TRSRTISYATWVPLPMRAWGLAFRRKSSACAAIIASRARMRVVLAAMARAWRAAIGPMLTWSSALADVGIVSTLAGWARLLFSDASAAEVYCTIMKPLF